MTVVFVFQKFCGVSIKKFAVFHG